MTRSSSIPAASQAPAAPCSESQTTGIIAGPRRTTCRLCPTRKACRFGRTDLSVARFHGNRRSETASARTTSPPWGQRLRHVPASLQRHDRQTAGGHHPAGRLARDAVQQVSGTAERWKGRHGLDQSGRGVRGDREGHSPRGREVDAAGAGGRTCVHLSQHLLTSQLSLPLRPFVQST